MNRAHGGGGVRDEIAESVAPVSSAATKRKRHVPFRPRPRTRSPAPPFTRVSSETASVASSETPPADVKSTERAAFASRSNGVGAMATAPADAKTVWLRGLETTRRRSMTRTVFSVSPEATSTTTRSESAACVIASAGEPSSHAVSDGRVGFS